jgi:hypothetical protein
MVDVLAWVVYYMWAWRRGFSVHNSHILNAETTWYHTHPLLFNPHSEICT